MSFNDHLYFTLSIYLSISESAECFLTRSRWDLPRTIPFINPSIQRIHCDPIYNQKTIDKWIKGCILPFPKKDDLGIAKNYRGVALMSIVVKIYNTLLRNRIEPTIENILRKNQNSFRRNRSTTSQILTIRRILKCVHAKNLETTTLFVDFSKAFDSIQKVKMG